MSRLMLVARLVTRTAIHPGGGQSAEGVDALLRRTAAGDVFIPGSALGGALRGLATRLAPRLGAPICRALLSVKDAQEASQKNLVKGKRIACQCAVCRLFGTVDPQETNEAATGGAASRLWIMDALPEATRETTVRDGVGIDRRTGASARTESLKYNLEVLPAGSAFTLRLELDDPQGLDEPLLAACLAEWVAGRASVGGRVSRGLGAFKVEALKVERLELNDAATLLQYLKKEGSAGRTLVSEWPSQAEEQASAWLQAQVREIAGRVTPLNKIELPLRHFVAATFAEIELDLQARGPFIANSPARAQLAGVDHAPLVEGRPVLPGASLRGVLRSQAERIARTWATNLDAKDLPGLENLSDRDIFSKKCPACDPGVRKAESPLQSCDSLLGKPSELDAEVPADGLCLACQLFGSARWGSRLVVEDAPLAPDSKLIYKVQDFLAIDRFTGGGRDSAKFDAVVLWQPKFRARLRLENPQPWELGWLILTLRDLAEGWLTLGFGSAKGFGKVTVPAWTVRLGRIDANDLMLTTGTTSPAAEDEVPSLYKMVLVQGEVACCEAARSATWSIKNGDAAAWLAQAGEWVKAWQAALKTFERGAAGPPVLPGVDTYFGVAAGGGKTLPNLYPRTKEALTHAR